MFVISAEQIRTCIGIMCSLEQQTIRTVTIIIAWFDYAKHITLARKEFIQTGLWICS